VEEPVGLEGQAALGAEVPGDVAYKRLILTHHKDLNRGDFLIDDRDRSGTRPVAVVSEAFTAKYFGPGDPIGRTFRVRGRAVSVVGVMRNSRYDRLDEAPQPYFCLPIDQFDYTPRLMLLVDAVRAEPARCGGFSVRRYPHGIRLAGLTASYRACFRSEGRYHADSGR
jgi:hypothetical protein